MNTNQHSNQYPRFHLNKNLHVIHGGNYQGFNIISSKSPFIKEWLDATLDTTYLALQQYPRVTIIRFDLRFPDYVPYFDDSVDSHSKLTRSSHPKLTHPLLLQYS